MNLEVGDNRTARQEATRHQHDCGNELIDCEVCNAPVDVGESVRGLRLELDELGAPRRVCSDAARKETTQQ
jgi:hypothetical protein